MRAFPVRRTAHKCSRCFRGLEQRLHAGANGGRRIGRLATEVAGSGTTALGSGSPLAGPAVQASPGSDRSKGASAVERLSVRRRPLRACGDRPAGSASDTNGHLHVAQVDARVEHGRDERVPEYVRVRSGDLDAGGLGGLDPAPALARPDTAATSMVRRQRLRGDRVRRAGYRGFMGCRDAW
jgi:hypothetical protein